MDGRNLETPVEEKTILILLSCYKTIERARQMADIYENRLLRGHTCAMVFIVAI